MAAIPSGASAAPIEATPVATIAAPAPFALASFPQTFSWRINASLPVRVYVAASYNPGLIIGSREFVKGSGSIALSAAEWNAITTGLGKTGGYYWWAIGSAHDGGKTLYSYWQPIVDGRSQIISHVDGATLPAGPTTFTWDAGSHVESYALWIGSEPGARDIYARNEGRSRSRTVHLPNDGRPVYVRLYSLLDGTWDHFLEYSFVTSATNPSRVKARMLSPFNGLELTSAQTTFSWDAGIGAQKYALWVGSKPGKFDLFHGDIGKGLSKTVSLPTDGRQIYVRLWTMFNGTWTHYNSYSYPGPFVEQDPAELLTPTNGAVLSRPVTFTWSPGTKAERYALWVGSTPGSSDLYAGELGLGLSKTIGVPFDGRPIYVRLSTRFNGAWHSFRSYNFTAPTYAFLLSNVNAQMISPENVTMLTSPNVTFTWNAGVGAQRYALWIGSAPGKSDLFSGDLGTELTKTVSLPTDGRQIHVRLWTMFNGKWEKFNAYTYTAPLVVQEPATLLAPAPGATLESGPVTFTWDGGTGAEGYALRVGSTPDSDDIYEGVEGLELSRTLTVPQDGRPVYVRLSTRFNGAWSRFHCYPFTAPIAPAANVKAQIVSPENTSTLTSQIVTFTWNAGIGAQRYALWVGSAPGKADLFGADLGTSLSQTITLPPRSRTVFVRLWTMFNGTWKEFNTYTYTCQFRQISAATMVSPTPGSTLFSGPTTFRWNHGGSAEYYALWVGSSPDAYDIYEGLEELRTSKTIDLPADGSPVYVKLWTLIDGRWDLSQSYSYNTSTTPSNNGSAVTTSATVNLGSGSGFWGNGTIFTGGLAVGGNLTSGNLTSGNLTSGTSKFGSGPLILGGNGTLGGGTLTFGGNSTLGSSAPDSNNR